MSACPHALLMRWYVDDDKTIASPLKPGQRPTHATPPSDSSEDAVPKCGTMALPWKLQGVG